MAWNLAVNDQITFYLCFKATLPFITLNQTFLKRENVFDFTVKTENCQVKVYLSY